MLLWNGPLHISQPKYRPLPSGAVLAISSQQSSAFGGELSQATSTQQTTPPVTQNATLFSRLPSSNNFVGGNAGPHRRCPSYNSPLSDRVGYVLEAVSDAGFSGLEDVLAQLYCSQFAGNAQNERICQNQQTLGWEDRIEHMIGSMSDSIAGPTGRTRNLSFKRAIFKASITLYKEEFERFANRRGGREKPYLLMKPKSITPNFLASNVIGEAQIAFEHNASLRRLPIHSPDALEKDC